MRNPYMLDRPAIISFSGGRTSGYMLWHILQAFGGKLPPDVVPVFANTGKERPETLDFIERCSQRWGVEVIWLEYSLGAAFKFRRVDYATASRNGEPFDQLLTTRRILPNVVTRDCTSWLKIKVANRFARHVLGWTPKRGGYTDAVGLRYDEPQRVARLKPDNKSNPGCDPVAPLYAACVTRHDVVDFWKRQSFDLALKSYQGNCDLCFLKGQGKLMQIMSENPELAQWWIEKERLFTSKETCKFEAGRFRKAAPSYAATLKMVQEQQLLPFAEDDVDDLATYCRCTD